MKEKSNNEIDLLLRRLSRQDGLRRDGEARDSQLGQHLDVDELSSYAENALPAAARARYTEHLADCSTCRKLVTELSLSLGATAAASAPAETVPMPGGLKQFLASLFSPMVLRYAVPALGLLVVAVIGFVTLRQEDQRGSVAQINPEQQERVPVTAMPSAPAGESPAAGAIDPKREGANANAEDRAKETAPRSASASGEPAGTGPVLAAPPIRREQTLADAPPTVEAEPAPPRPAKA
ncbi:MAG TPA: zf-HC2 domain-containing protein, partial [Pyrinomonadaceae bacterium]|nr:zf-HC2 domain-containing protein [Pyrinomonadaceae bacterium]